MRLIGLAVVLSMIFAPLAADAQPAGKVPRVAYLSASSAASATWGVEAFRQGLRELGYVEGRTLFVLIRQPLVALGHIERLMSRGTLAEQLRKS